MRTFLFFVYALSCLLLPLQATADDMRPASLTLSALDETSYQVSWQRPIKNGVLPKLEIVFDDRVNDLTPRTTENDGATISQYWRVSAATGLAGTQIKIEGLEGSRYQIIARLVDLEGQVFTTMLNTETPTLDVPLSLDGSAMGIAGTYIYYGVEHILIGLDHLLFVACLVYIARSGRKLFWAITGFTLAHSVTLILAATDTLTVPIAPVEAVIALSIVFLAAEIARNNKNSLSLTYPVLVSSSFGLLHGFGFASVLADIGLPSSEKVLALLCFNLGVEIGQLLFVGALFVTFFILNKLYKAFTVDRLRLPASYLCGSLASFWMLERLAAF